MYACLHLCVCVFAFVCVCVCPSRGRGCTCVYACLHLCECVCVRVSVCALHGVGDVPECVCVCVDVLGEGFKADLGAPHGARGMWVCMHASMHERIHACIYSLMHYSLIHPCMRECVSGVPEHEGRQSMHAQQIFLQTLATSSCTHGCPHYVLETHQKSSRQLSQQGKSGAPHHTHTHTQQAEGVSKTRQDKTHHPHPHLLGKRQGE